MENKKKYFAVLFFNTELEIGKSNNPNKWVCTGIKKFTDGAQALYVYANTPNPASQLIDAYSQEELNNKIQEMFDNYNNQKWLNEHLYPYL